MITAGIGTSQTLGTHRPTELRVYTLADGTRVLDFDALLESGGSLSIPVAFDPADLIFLWIESNARATIARGSAGTSEVQSLSIIGGPPTLGSFTLAYSGASTGSIPWNATASQVATAVAASTAIGTGNVSCSGGPLPGTPVTMTFAPSLGNVPAPLVGLGTLDAGTPSVSTTTNGAAGSSADVTPIEPGWPTVWVRERPDPCPFTAAVTSIALAALETGRQTQVRFRALLED